MLSKSSLLTPQQVARELGIQPSTIYDWTYRGIIPHIRILAGTTRAVIRFRQQDLDQFIADRTVKARRSHKRSLKTGPFTKEAQEAMSADQTHTTRNAYGAYGKRVTVPGVRREGLQ